MEKKVTNVYWCNKCGYSNLIDDDRNKIQSFCEEWGEYGNLILLKSNPNAKRNTMISIDYLDGVSITDISLKYNLSKTRVTQILWSKPYRKFIWQCFETIKLKGKVKYIRRISTAYKQKLELEKILDKL